MISLWLQWNICVFSEILLNRISGSRILWTCCCTCQVQAAVERFQASADFGRSHPLSPCSLDCTRCRLGDKLGSSVTSWAYCLAPLHPSLCSSLTLITSESRPRCWAPPKIWFHHSCIFNRSSQDVCFTVMLILQKNLAQTFAHVWVSPAE